MSAFLCSASHLSAIVNAARATGFGLMPAPPGGPSDAEWTFANLLDENQESLIARYGKAEDASGGYGNTHEVIRTPAQIAKACKLIACYQYQACEHDAWETSEAKRWPDALGDAPWGL